MVAALTYFTGDAGPDLLMQLTDKSTGEPMSLAGSNVRVWAKFRKRGAASNVFTVSCRSIGFDAMGYCALEIPPGALDLDPGNYEIQISVHNGFKPTTAIDSIPVRLRQSFPTQSIMRDDLAAKLIGGKLFIRNIDTDRWHELSLSDAGVLELPATGSTYASLDDERFTAISARLTNGRLYFHLDNAYREFTVSGAGIPTPTLGPEIKHFDSLSLPDDDLYVYINKGKLMMRNTTTGTVHEVSITGDTVPVLGVT